ncbi:MAG: glucose-6-phosphate isomerase [Muribaculaceae bacterium]|nr:glucose-6-phosphate isomerase [Muribaculaceae bacterium]
MKSIEINIKDALSFVSAERVSEFNVAASEGIANLNETKGAGSDFHGWVNLASETTQELVADINATAQRLRKECEYVVCIGIGGSYLGAKAVIEALSNAFDAYTATPGCPKVLFAGQNIGEDYMHELQTFLADKRFGIIVISKSGTTTEPAIAFRLLKEQLERQAGKDAAKNLIVAITDEKRGALRQLANEEGYTTYVIADNVGGRFSVLSPVGLLPIAVAGHDINALLQGAVEMEKTTKNPGEENIAETYAKVRNALYAEGKKIEILVNYNPKLHFLAEWWKQLYGESEGKEGKGIFPASVDLTTDLHSMGQWIQEGERTIFETVLSVEEPNHECVIPSDVANLDGLNYIAGKRIDYVNKMAEIGTRIAHVEGGVPNIRITIPRLDEHSLGQLIYFFEKGCGISGYILGVNPFDQPGVEAYKKNMFALLEKPGYEEASKAIKQKL